MARGPHVRRELALVLARARFPAPRALASGSELERDDQRRPRPLSRRVPARTSSAGGRWAACRCRCIEAVRRRGLPALGVVVDDWLVYGPRGRWLAAGAAPGPGSAGSPRRAIGGPDRRSDSPGPTAGSSSATRPRAARSPSRRRRRRLAAGRAPRRRPRGLPRRRVARVARGGCSAWAGSTRARAATARRGARRAARGCTLRVVGDGDPEHLAASSRARRRARGRRPGRVRSRSARGRVAAAYADADAVLFPVQWEEPWGLVPLEAMAVGRPVIATGTGGSAEYLRDGENCLIYAPARRSAAPSPARSAAWPAIRSFARGLRDGRRGDGGPLTARAFNDAVDATRRRGGRQRERGRSRSRSSPGTRASCSTAAWPRSQPDAESGRGRGLGRRQRLERRLGRDGRRAPSRGSSWSQRGTTSASAAAVNLVAERTDRRRGWPPRTPTSSCARARSRRCSSGRARPAAPGVRRAAAGHPDGDDPALGPPVPRPRPGAALQRRAAPARPALGERLGGSRAAGTPSGRRRSAGRTARSCSARRRRSTQVGGFDPEQWMYAEDIDLGWRLARGRLADAGTSRRRRVHHDGSAATSAGLRRRARCERHLAAAYHLDGAAAAGRLAAWLRAVRTSPAPALRWALDVPLLGRSRPAARRRRESYGVCGAGSRSRGRP